MKKIISILICLSLAICLAGCDDAGNEAVAGFEYYHYEKDDFRDKADELEALADTGSSDKINELYDWLYDQCVELDSLYAVSYAMHSANMANEYYDREQLYCYKTLVDLEDCFCRICRKITEGPSSEDFKEHVGGQAFDAFAGYEVLTGEEKKLIKREQKLVDMYYDRLDEVEAEGTEFRGSTWTMNELMGDEGSDLAVSDYDAYLKLYNTLTKAANEATGPIYVKLVRLRDRLAEINGYDSYADYADREIYCRDYDGDDLKQLHEDTKKISEEYNENYYDAAMSGNEPAMPDMTAGQLIRNLEKYSGKISSAAGSCCRKMLKEKLYDIGESQSRQDGAYTAMVHRTGKPFIFQTMNHAGDFATLTHEFGHFVQYELTSQENILTDTENLDLAEISSNGFEALMTNYYDDIFGDEAEAAGRYTVSELLLNLIDGCIMDEFQREVYSNPDMSLDEINRAYSEISAEYDGELEGDPGCNWVYVSHNFDSPMYYISYAASSLAVLQIWKQGQKDFESAVGTWEKITRIGYFNQDYMDVLDKCGLIKFTEKGAALKICKPALKTAQARLP